MKKAIGGRGKKSHLTGIPPTPKETKSTYETVLSSITQNIETSLINNVFQFPTAKALCEGLATTYGSGTNSMEIYDLHQKENTQKQGQDTLEDFWNKLQAIWMAIDRKQPNPMKCSDHITILTTIPQIH